MFGGFNHDRRRLLGAAAMTAAGFPAATVTANCIGIAPTFIQRGNPDLESEKSESTTLGVVWEPTPRTSLTADLWQIKRKGLPVIEDTQAAIDAGHFVRDPSTSLGAGDPGGILSAAVLYVNSAESLTRGLDIEAKHRFDLGGARANGNEANGLAVRHDAHDLGVFAAPCHLGVQLDTECTARARRQFRG